MNSLADFWALVDKNGPIPKHKPELGPCWIWTGGTNGKDYGVYRMNGSLQYAHRIALSTEVGQLPSSRQACHKCDNPPCVRPSHLYVGTHSSNLRDAYRRRRRARKGLPPVARGEKHWKAKLSEEAVRKLRELGEEGVPQLELAKRFGVNQSTVQRVLSRKAWASVK